MRANLNCSPCNYLLQCEREVSDLMFKSLKLCESLQFPDKNVNRDVRQRIGTIHYRLASLYHNSYRMLVSCALYA